MRMMAKPFRLGSGFELRMLKERDLNGFGWTP